MSRSRSISVPPYTVTVGRTPRWGLGFWDTGAGFLLGQVGPFWFMVDVL